MSDRYLTDLLTTRTVEGRPATAQDFADAMRVLHDAYSAAQQHDDAVASVMALTLLGSVGAAAGRSQPYGPRVSRKRPIPF
jgi:hypothetical protein